MAPMLLKKLKSSLIGALAKQVLRLTSITIKIEVDSLMEEKLKTLIQISNPHL